MANVHTLKCAPEYYLAILSGRKRFEVRFNDRDYQVGDWLHLLEYDTKRKGTHYTGQGLTAMVTYILTDFVGLQDGYIVMGIRL